MASMTTFLFYACAVAFVAAVGFCLHLFIERKPSASFSAASPFSRATTAQRLSRLQDGPAKHVTRTEWVVGTLVASLVVLPTVTLLGSAIAKGQAMTYHEYWSGLEEKASVKTITCERDGSCRHTYDCDHYTVTVTKTRSVPAGRDSNGNTKYRTETYTEQEDRYHSCPYVEAEYTYTVEDTMGETYTMGSHWFPAEPERHRWTGRGHNRPRWGFGMPALPKKVSAGEPRAWAAAKARLDAGNPGGTTKRHKYKNYILASTEDIYAKHSDAIDGFKAEGLLPAVQTEVYDEYRSDKVYFVGEKPAEASAWLEEAQRLNGYLGSERQGDLHVVVVTSPAVTDVDSYTQALEAYWQSEELGRDTLSKNGLALVLKLDPTAATVEAARAFTGMPMGNEALVQNLQNVAGAAATPALLTKSGPVGDLLLAEEEGFTRVEMQDYEYLADSVRVGLGAQLLIFFVGLLLSMGVWAIMFAVDLRWAPIENLRRRVGP